MPTPAREAAFEILLRVEQRHAYASELLHSERVHKLSTEDRRLCTELVMGALRWRSRLDLGIGAVASQPLPKLDPEVLTTLRLGAYQIGFLRLPARAAVNESVALVKRAHKKSAAPFVNAVLRKLAAKPDLMSPVLPPGRKTAGDIAQIHSHPLWLVERWAAQYGLETTEKICAYDQNVPPAAVRLWDPSVEDELQREGIELSPGALLRSARLVTHGDVTHTRAFHESRVVLQDEGSQLIALLVGTGERLLDCCAAPGGKTAVMARRNRNSLVVATELHPHRAAALANRLRGSENVRVVAGDAVALPLRGDFDRVLADVPCSGTGTLARNPEIKWRLAVEDLSDLHRRQEAILQSALERLRPGGRLVYSSCSLEREENEAVMDSLSEPFRLVGCREELAHLRDAGELVWQDIESLTDSSYVRTLPGVHPCDGFFAALIERTH